MIYTYTSEYVYRMNMYCLHAILDKRLLHYIQPPFLCVQMSIESEMSHQRFRFLLQSGVWHLFSYFDICVLCSMCHPNACSCNHVVFLQQNVCDQTRQMTNVLVPIPSPHLLSSFPPPYDLLFLLRLSLSFYAAFQPRPRGPFPGGVPS